MPFYIGQVVYVVNNCDIKKGQIKSGKITGNEILYDISGMIGREEFCFVELRDAIKCRNTEIQHEIDKYKRLIKKFEKEMVSTPVFK